MKRLILDIIKKYFPVVFVKYRYFKVFGKKLNLKNPTGFNEKILWLTLFWQDQRIVQCADKYGLRQYVIGCLGSDNIMPRLYGVYEKVDDVRWEQFPKKFVIKCTHGCKYNILCENKEKLDINKAKDALATWMNTEYGPSTYEPQYYAMKHRIISEEYIETDSGLYPEDYKLYCFNGKVKAILVCLNRENVLNKNEELILEWYDLKWKVLDIGAKPNKQLAMKPTCLEKMVEYAEKLSKPFPFVRVDFYDRHEPILGEMTFTPMYGMAKYYSESGNKLLGSWLVLPDHKMKRKYKKED